MMGIKERNFKRHKQVDLEELVPADNFYRQLEAKLDLNFVRDLVAAFYAPFGRPSIDPVVFFKLQLIMVFEGLRSERQLMERVHLNLAFRWYIGYDLTEPIPDHSSMTKIRERYGLAVFRRFFEHIVELCIEAGLVWGKEVYLDGTRVQANADLQSNVRNFEYELRNHLNILFADQQTPSAPEVEPESDWIERWHTNYQTIERKRDKTAYRSLALKRTSLTDPDATPIRGKKEIGYHTHYMVDGGRNRIILGVMVTSANITDNIPMLDLIRWGRFRWRIKPRIAVADSQYGTVDNIVGLFADYILPYMPRTDFKKPDKFTYDQFRYDPEHNVYYCPQGHSLKQGALDRDHRTIIYQASVRDCRPCPVRSQCTTAKKKGRRISRSYFQEQLDWAAKLRETEAFAKAMRKRALWVEPLFGEAKQWHGLYRFRLRRIRRVNIEAFLIASVQNLKRLLNPRYGNWKRPDPTNSAALSLPMPTPLTLSSAY